MDSNFFKFASKIGLEQILENSSWMIRTILIILATWFPNACLTKSDITSVPVWVKLHDVLIAAFTKDCISMIATKLGKSIFWMLIRVLCVESWDVMVMQEHLLKLLRMTS